MLAKVSPSSSSVIHSVHFYDHDDALIQRLRGIVISAVETGNSILIVATPEHRAQLASELEKSDLDLTMLAEEHRLTLRDAREILDKFMVNGSPHPKRFAAALVQLIAAARRGAWNAQRGLTVFGEMVSLLWEEGKPEAALELEDLWNRLLGNHAFHLHCAYPRRILSEKYGSLRIRAICDEHSHVIGAA